jgi:uncharacterized protein (DUF2141 family)
MSKGGGRFPVDEKTFPDEHYQGQRISAAGEIMVITFTNLPKGSYAVSVYQDSNDNEQLDKGFLGIPKERFGFSNDRDRPDYRRCLFDFNADMTITVRIREFWF